MIKADRVAELLKKQLELMETLSGHELGGFALICPPEGDPIDISLVTSHSDPAAFYKMVAEKCSATAKEYGEKNAWTGGAIARVR